MQINRGTLVVVILLSAVFGFSACSDGGLDSNRFGFVVQEREAEVLKPLFDLGKEISLYTPSDGGRFYFDTYPNIYKVTDKLEEFTVKLSVAVDIVKSEKGRRVLFFYLLANQNYMECFRFDRGDSFWVIPELVTNAETCRKSAEDILLGRVDDYEVTVNKNSGMVEVRPLEGR